MLHRPVRNAGDTQSATENGSLKRKGSLKGKRRRLKKNPSGLLAKAGRLARGKGDWPPVLGQLLVRGYFPADGVGRGAGSTAAAGASQQAASQHS